MVDRLSGSLVLYKYNQWLGGSRKRKGGDKLATSLRRLSVSIPSDIEEDLDKLKREQFYKEPQSEMLRYLIRLGLQLAKEQGMLKTTN